MDLLEDLQAKSKQDQINAAKAAFLNIVGKAVSDDGLEKYKSLIVENKEAGTITVGEMTFICTENKLRLMGFCQSCYQEVPSVPIRRLADIADLNAKFRPDKHDCFEP